MTIYQFEEFSPEIDESAFVAEEAVVIGRIKLGPNSSIWPCAVLRGDNEPITLGAGSNAQDGAVLHTDPGYACTIGDNVTIGHQAMLHGCTGEDGAVIGIQARVRNGAGVGQAGQGGGGPGVAAGKW